MSLLKVSIKKSTNYLYCSIHYNKIVTLAIIVAKHTKSNVNETKFSNKTCFYNKKLKNRFSIPSRSIITARRTAALVAI